MKTSLCLTVATLLLAAANLSAATHYVSLGSTSPTPPYSTWATAARNIQAAVDSAAPSDQIVVTNGVYPGGVAVTSPLALWSVNGPQFTVINGGGTNRCVSLPDGASLSGFTLTNGDYFAENGAGVWCSSTNAFLTNCVIVGNSAWGCGGGAYGGTLYNCTLSGNSAKRALDNTGFGGGAEGATLYNCTLTDNSANYGGGVYNCTLYDCQLSGNRAEGYWYAAWPWGGLPRYVAGVGGGAEQCTLYNCTLTGNSSTDNVGGADSSALYNCIVYCNTAPQEPNYDTSSTLNYCCTTPLPTNGVANIAVDPQLASASHLSADSPCRWAGCAAYATGTDLDGEAWGNPPSIGCDEYHAGAVTGPLLVNWLAGYRVVTVGYPLAFTAFIVGRTTESVWAFGDGDVDINEPYVTHAWTEPGDYPVALWAFNESHPEGVSAMGIIHVAVHPVLYVAATSTNPQPPYLSWATAAPSIQEAVNVAGPGAEIVVANGVYGGGVTVTNPLTLRSVNGPPFTVIDGGGTNRCASLTDGASLSGFTLTNGNAYSGGGVWCASTDAVLTNCVIVGNSAWGSGRGASVEGGGVYGGTLYDCALSGNTAVQTGGGYAKLTGKDVSGMNGGAGGGAAGSTLCGCTLTGNSAGSGGGASSCTLHNCTLTDNSAASGGGAYSGTLNNCTLSGNSADWEGGGACAGALNNCTLTGNSAGSGGGAYAGTLYNCIVYSNTAPSDVNYDSTCTLSYCCTTPLPPGIGNISANPRMTDSAHVSSDSPCVGAGNFTYTTGTDIDGEAWANPPAIGCDEFQAGPVTGPLMVTLAADYTNVVAGFAVQFSAHINGHALANVWDFDDGTFVINEPWGLPRSFAIPGDYTVTLWAYNDSRPEGASASVAIHVGGNLLHYVSAANQNPVAPYASWATAATNIQDAVDAASVGAAVLVANGTYASGGRPTPDSVANRVVLDKPLTLRSVNGAQVTVIDGNRAMRCAYLAKGASITGFTLTRGTACGADAEWPAQCGGGVWCESSEDVVSNCVITGNAAYYGGGASGGTLYNCTVTGNSAVYDGGGAYEGTLYNCTLTGNSATRSGGGAYAAALYNCVVWLNTSAQGPNYDSCYTLNYCCTTPLPPGTGNIAADPLLTDSAHVSAGSPCVGAGNFSYASGTDVDGEAWANPPSIGCDEFHAGPVAGPLAVSIAADYTNATAGFVLNFTGQINGHSFLNVWDFDDGTFAIREPCGLSHSFAAPGDYLITLRAYNDSHPEGVSASLVIHVYNGLHYVSASNLNPVAPYTSWATAATSIQEAIDAAGVGGTILVTNGTYAASSRATPDSTTNRVVLAKLLTLRSINGAQSTVIDGNRAMRCAYLGKGASITGFTLTNGTAGDGGGVWCGAADIVVSNCVITSNSATWYGGGAYGGTLRDCTLTLNSAGSGGGGSCSCILSNCILIRNSASGGGGAAGGALYNCTLSGNSAGADGGGAEGSTLYNCKLFLNSAGYYGGGASTSTLTNCTVSGNSAYYGGGGASDTTLDHCTLTGNSATYYGGAGAYECTLTTCVLQANSSSSFGGGACDSTLNNCTLIANSAAYDGGGASTSTLTNCTLVRNSARDGGGAHYSTLYNCALTGNSAANTYDSFGSGGAARPAAHFTTAR